VMFKWALKISHYPAEIQIMSDVSSTM